MNNSLRVAGSESILVVDDAPENLRLPTTGLQSKGFFEVPAGSKPLPGGDPGLAIRNFEPAGIELKMRLPHPPAVPRSQPLNQNASLCL